MYQPDLFDPATPYEGIPGTELAYPVQDRIPGWLEVGMFFQTYPPAHASWDPAVIKAVREFDPYFVPLWVNWVWKRPLDDSSSFEWYCFGRHVLARQVPDPKNEHPPVQPLLQGLGPIVRPNVLLEILHDNRPDPEYHEMGVAQLPGRYIPFNWAVWKGLRRAWVHDNKKPGEDDIAGIHKAKEDRDKFLENWLAEFRRDQADLQKFAQKKLDAMGETSALRHFKWVEEQKRKGFDPLTDRMIDVTRH